MNIALQGSIIIYIILIYIAFVVYYPVGYKRMVGFSITVIIITKNIYFALAIIKYQTRATLTKLTITRTG